MAKTAPVRRKKNQLPAVNPQPPAESFPALPPLPVFDDHVDLLAKDVENFACQNEEDFKAGAAWRGRAVALRSQIEDNFKPRKRAFDDMKQPTLDAEKAYLTRINALVGSVDSRCIAWQREERRKADEEAERLRQEEVQRRTADQQRRAQILREFGEPEAAAEEESKAIIPPRPCAPEVPTYAKGVRTAPKLVAVVVQPSKVKREYCQPAQSQINAEVQTFMRFNKHPTGEQIKELAEKIGGVELKWQ